VTGSGRFRCGSGTGGSPRAGDRFRGSRPLGRNRHPAETWPGRARPPLAGRRAQSLAPTLSPPEQATGGGRASAEHHPAGPGGGGQPLGTRQQLTQPLKSGSGRAAGTCGRVLVPSYDSPAARRHPRFLGLCQPGCSPTAGRRAAKYAVPARHIGPVCLDAGVFRFPPRRTRNGRPPPGGGLRPTYHRGGQGRNRVDSRARRRPGIGTRNRRSRRGICPTTWPTFRRGSNTR
jgi:hypothetical protein